MAVENYKINYKSDFVITIDGDAGWSTPFCIKFWTGMPAQGYFAGYNGEKYVNCRLDDEDPSKLVVLFDDHHLPIGELKMQIAYHTTIEEFPNSVFDSVTNACDVIVEIDNTEYQVELDFDGETAPELEFDLPAYANEAERVQNELQRQQNEAQRIQNELQRQSAAAGAIAGAQNVNAQLDGYVLTVTNRNGVSTSVDTKGEKGDTGDTGPQGPIGLTGVSITSFVYLSETEEYMTYTVNFSDGTTQTVNIPKGEKGDTGNTGPQGATGNGIASTTLNADYTLTITYTNGTSWTTPNSIKGDTAVVDGTDTYTLYNNTGTSTTGAMTQNATTLALADAATAEGTSYDNSQSGLAAENVQEAVDELDDNAYLGSGTNVRINLSDYATIQTWPNVGNDNKWLTDSSTYPYKGKFIPITAGKSYKIVAQESVYAQYAMLRSEAYTNHANGTSVQYATGCTRKGIAAGMFEIVKAPDDAAYLYITTFVDADCTPSVVLEYNNISIKDFLGDMDEEPTDNSNKLVSSGGVYDAIFDAAIMEDVPYNYTPGYKLDENGVPVVDLNYGISDFLECQYQDEITSYHGATDTVASMVVFNSSKTKLNYYRNKTSPSRTVTVSNTGVAYFRVSFNLDYANAGAAVNGVRVFTPVGGVKTAKDAINELQSEVNEIPNQIDAAIEKAKPSLKNLYMGTLVNSYQNDNGELQPDDSRSSTRVTNKSMLCVPYHGVKVTFKIPDNIAIVIWGWILPQNIHSSSSGWLTSATTSYTFPDEIRAYRIIFVTNNTNHNGNIAASYVQGLIDSGDISFTYEDTYPSMLERNTYKSNLLRAALAIRPGHEPCVFSHISDIHGDVTRLQNFYEYSKYLKVDACLATGDYVTDNYGNRNEFINEVFDGEQLALCVVGNHEFKNIGSADSYAEYTQTLAERYNYLEESGVVTTHNYYYYDIATKNIRVIAIDQFNGYYGSKDLGGKIGQNQLDWLVATLGSTPAGYGVCVIMHVPETAVIRDPEYDTFYEPTLNTHDGLYESAVRPITHIIDAFINKSTWSANYTNAQSESISISCDFTNRDANTEFIAIFCGHTHEDRVGLANIQTSRQVIFSITIGNALYGPSSNGIWANASDLPRGGRGVCQDCFNIYSIERSTKTVKVIRIGSDITINMTDRKYMEIPYAIT